MTSVCLSLAAGPVQADSYIAGVQCLEAPGKSLYAFLPRRPCWHYDSAPVLPVPGCLRLPAPYARAGVGVALRRQVGKTIPADKIPDLDKKARASSGWRAAARKFLALPFHESMSNGGISKG